MRTRWPRPRKPAFKRFVIDSLLRGAPAVGYSGAFFVVWLQTQPEFVIAGF